MLKVAPQARQHRLATRAIPLLASLPLLLGGCGGFNINVWPFGNDKPQDRSRAPANATEFQCNAGKRFYVRSLDNGAAAWVIFTEREFRLDRVGEAGSTRYSNGSATLEINGAEASLTGAGPFDACKAAAAK